MRLLPLAALLFAVALPAAERSLFNGKDLEG